MTTQYPNNLTAAEYHELREKSGIDPDTIAKNFFHLCGDQALEKLLISDKIPRLNSGRVTSKVLRQYRHLEAGGMWISGLDPHNNWKPMEWGRFKPTQPRIDTEKGKPVKYESPPLTPNRVMYFDVSDVTWDIIAQRYNIKRYHSKLAWRLQDKFEMLMFWAWVQKHPEIPVILVEGEKKSAKLLSLGFATIGLPGIWNGRVGKKDFDERLHPDIMPLAQKGRKFIILFDYETNPKTRWSIFQAIVRTGKTLVALGCKCEVALLPGPEKGVDDFAVARGELAADFIARIINDAKTLTQYQKSFRHKLRGLNKYTPDQVVNSKYLSDVVDLDKLPVAGEPITYTQALTGGQSDLSDDNDENVQSVDPDHHNRKGLKRSVVLSSDTGTGKTELKKKWRSGQSEDSSDYIDENAQSPSSTQANNKKGLMRFVVLWSDMGTGKTELMRKWRDNNPNLRFLNNGHRVNLLKNLSIRLKTDMYNALSYGDLARAKALSITIDSLHKLNTNALEYDCVFIDEACQYLVHLLHSSTCKANRAAILEALEYIVSHASLLVIADAHMDDTTIDFFLAMLPEGVKPHIIKNEFKNGGRQVYWYEGKDDSAIVAKIAAALMSGQKVMTCSDSKRFIKKLERLLLMPVVVKCDEQESPDEEQKLRVWAIHGDNSGSEENVVFIQEITEAVKTVDALLITPSLGTGVDIAEYHFDLVFGVFHAVSQTATECAQQLHRYRPLVPFHIWVAPVPPFGYKETNPAKIKEQILQKNEMTAFLIRIDRQTGKRGAEKDWALDAYCQIESDRNSSLNNLRSDLQSLLADMGNEIIHLGEDTESGIYIKEQMKAASRALRNEHNKSVAASVDITLTEYLHRQSKDYLKPEEIFECEKFRIADAYGMEVTELLVEKDDGGRLIKQIAALEAILMESGGTITDAQGNEIPAPPSIVSEKDHSERLRLPFCMDWGNYSAQWQGRFILRLDTILKRLVSGERLTNADPDLIAMREIAFQHRPHIKAILNLTVPLDTNHCSPKWLLSKLLEQLGLKLVSSEVGPRGQQVLFFWLEVDSLAFSLSVLAHRERNKLLKAQRQRQNSREHAGYQARMQTLYGVGAPNSPVPTSPLLLNDFHPGGGGAENENFTDSWTKQLLSYFLPLRERLANGIEIIKQLLSTLPCDERLLAMVDFEESNPDKFAILNSVEPNWVEWCMG